MSFILSEGCIKVGRVSDFPSRTLKKVLVGGEEVLVVNVDGTLHAIANTCTHRGGPLNEGELEGNNVICPYHGGQFDVTTGKAVSPPPTKDEAKFNVQIQGLDVFLKKA